MQETEAYTEAIARLQTLGQRRDRLRLQLDAVETELRETIRGAAAAGVPKRVIARTAGVVRQTVYNVLGSNGGADG